jgi:hypothetical protein
MTWSWIGVDEAGYGARLGPLVVSASWWQIDSAAWAPDQLTDPSFLPSIDKWSWKNQFTNQPGDSTDVPPPQMVADSKRIYQAGQGLGKLERIVASLLDAIEHFRDQSRRLDGHSKVSSMTKLADLEKTKRPRNSADLSEITVDWPTARHQYLYHVRRVQPHAPGKSPYWLNEPHGSPPQESSMTQRRANPGLRDAWVSSAIRPMGLFSAVLSEQHFNDGLIRHGNKANLLSAESLLLANSILQQCPAGQTVVIDFDRHGGRKRYLPLLVEHFAADWPQTLGENELESSYRWDQDGRRVYARFTVDGEQRYPVAAASLASKYARELGMQCVNTFWQRLVPGLQASAGYPVDAVRMVGDLEAAIRPLPVPREQVWRNA